MGLLDTINKAFRGSETTPILTKKPGFSVTQFTTNNPFTNLIQPLNYFDQYILYTAKAIDYISNKVASSEIGLFDESDEEVDNDLWQDLKSFNPYMSLWEARKLKEMHLRITGTAYWYIDRDPIKNIKAEFYPLDPTQMKIKTNEYGLPAYYQYRDANGKHVELALEDVVYFRRMNPTNWFEGLSEIGPASFWTNAYAQGAQYNMNKLGNNTNVDKFLVFEGIGLDEKNKIEEQLKNKYEGPRNAGRTGVVNVEPKVVEMSSNQKDLDYVQGMKLLREDILAYFGIPEAVFFPSATNSNSTQAIRSFQQDTLEPALEQEKSVLNEQLLPNYKLSRPTKGLHFDFEGVVDDDEVQEATALKLGAEAATIAYNDGIITLNEYRDAIEMENIPGGDVYKTPTTTDSNIQTITDNAKSLKDELEKMMEQKEHAEMVTKSIALADEQEGIVYQTTEALFQDQFKRTIEYVNKIDEVNVIGVFNFKNEVEITKKAFAQVYAQVINNSNDVGNTELKVKLFKSNNPAFTFKAKSISAEALSEISKRLDYFANEITATTRDKLRKVIADGLQNGFDKDLFRASIETLFNEFIDGQNNIDILNRYKAYTPSITLNSDNQVITNSGTRYKEMLAKITNQWANGDITKTQRNEALAALRGIIDPSDPIGKDVDSLLNGWEIPQTKGITKSRAVTIARTEATFARNLGFNDVYSDNPFVVGQKWNSLHDKDVRDSHAHLDGTVVKIGEAFQGDSGKMRFPGDSSLGAGPEDTINCRCRVTAVVK